MGSKSVYLEKAVLDCYFGGTALTAPPATLYFALFTTSPTEGNDSGTEVSGNNYSRIAVVNDGTSFSAATQSGTSAASKTNIAAITWPLATGSWGTVVAFGVYDDPTAGNLLYWGTATSSTITAGKPYSVAAGNMTITET